MNSLKINCRTEEVPALSELTRDNYLRDQQLFAAFSPLFNDTFLEKYNAQEQKVKELVEPQTLTGEMKKITGRIAGHYEKARTIANKVEFFAEKAEALLNVKPTDFGFKVLRKSLKLKNDEGIIKGLRGMVQHIGANREALTQQGLTYEMYDEITGFIDAFEKDSLDQVRKLKERAELVKNNAGEFNAMWEMISTLCNAGQILAKERKDKAMLADYTMKKLVKKVRIMRKSNEDAATGEMQAA
jgi:hypothetical protein